MIDDQPLARAARSGIASRDALALLAHDLRTSMTIIHGLSLIHI